MYYQKLIRTAASSQRYKLACIIFGAFCTHSLMANDNVFKYPLKGLPSVEVGKEDYQKKTNALKVIKKIHIDDKIIKNSTRSRGLVLRDNLFGDINNRLNEAGIEVVSNEEIQQEPGQPRLDIYPSLPPFSTGKDGKKTLTNPNCCTAGLWVQFTQGAKILTTPDENYRLGTWGEGANTRECGDLGTWYSDVLLEKIDNFIASRKKALLSPVKSSPKKIVTVESPEVGLPSRPNSSCNAAPLMFTDAFVEDSDKIRISTLPELVEVSDIMKSCPEFIYTVETHSDTRGEAGFNFRLSERRARQISLYLLQNGVNKNRFNVRPMGENHAIFDAQTAEEHGANRRIVIIPSTNE